MEVNVYSEGGKVLGEKTGAVIGALGTWILSDQAVECQPYSSVAVIGKNIGKRE